MVVSLIFRAGTTTPKHPVNPLQTTNLGIKMVIKVNYHNNGTYKLNVMIIKIYWALAIYQAMHCSELFHQMDLLIKNYSALLKKLVV